MEPLGETDEARNMPAFISTPEVTSLGLQVSLTRLSKTAEGGEEGAAEHRCRGGRGAKMFTPPGSPEEEQPHRRHAVDDTPAV